MDIIAWLVEWINYLMPVAFVIFMIYYLAVSRKQGKRLMKHYHEAIDKNLELSKQTVELLREIKELLKK